MTTFEIFATIYIMTFILSLRRSARAERTDELLLREEIAREEAKLFFQNGLL